MRSYRTTCRMLCPRTTSAFRVLEGKSSSWRGIWMLGGWFPLFEESRPITRYRSDYMAGSSWRRSRSSLSISSLPFVVVCSRLMAMKKSPRPEAPGTESVRLIGSFRSRAKPKNTASCGLSHPAPTRAMSSGRSGRWPQSGTFSASGEDKSPVTLDSKIITIFITSKYRGESGGPAPPSSEPAQGSRPPPPSPERGPGRQAPRARIRPS